MQTTCIASHQSHVVIDLRNQKEEVTLKTGKKGLKYELVLIYTTPDPLF